MEQLKPKVIHINSYFFSNALHFQLVKKLAAKGVSQSVYIPLQKGESYSEPESIEGVRFYIKEVFNKLSRKIWLLKILSIYKFVVSRLPKEEVHIIHAHSLFVNGFVAYLLHKKWNTRYIVTVRNTDINIFMKFSLFRKLGFKIMDKADVVCTLSHSYFDIHLKKHYSKEHFLSLKKKHQVIPNGAEDIWFENSFDQNNQKEILQIVFVGLIAENKNLRNVIAACNILKERGHELNLKVVGSGRLEAYFKSLNYNFNIEFLGYINDRQQLMKIYRESDVLCVPSYTESFGLVYVEAMTQSLPVIYSENQGFDGFFPNGEVGYAVNPKSPEDIAKALINVKSNYLTLSKNALIAASQFKWDTTVNKLIQLYR